MARVWLAGLLACCAWVAGCGVESAEPPAASSSPTPPTTSATAPAGFDDPAAAIAAYLSGEGLQYTGVCQPEPPISDVGKYCSTVVADRGSELVVKVGLVRAEYDTYLLVQRTAGGWLAVKSADVPFPDDGTLPF